MAMLAVYDMVGKQILSENINLQQGKANHTVNVSNLPSGNYIALVQAAGEVVKQRFVREWTRREIGVVSADSYWHET